MVTGSYNERLFRGGIRRFIHMGRFRWLERRLAELDADATTFVELGCYDGRAIEHLPGTPVRYVGYDANVEGGLDLGRAKWADYPEYSFRLAHTAEQVDIEDRFDVGICMETLEHVPDELVDGYIDALAAIVRRRIYVTLPNEKYLPFLIKHVYHMFVGGGERYAAREVVNVVLGRVDRVERHEHKGFDYEHMIRRLERRFAIDSVEGQPVPEFPPWISTGVSIIARPKPKTNN